MEYMKEQTMNSCKIRMHNAILAFQYSTLEIFESDY